MPEPKGSKLREYFRNDDAQVNDLLHGPFATFLTILAIIFVIVFILNVIFG